MDTTIVLEFVRKIWYSPIKKSNNLKTLIETFTQIDFTICEVYLFILIYYFKPIYKYLLDYSIIQF